MLNRRVEGQQGSGRRRLFWEEEGLITRAPPRPGPTPPPAGPQPLDRPYFPGSGRREEGLSQRLPDDRPAYRGGGYGFPKISRAREGTERGRGIFPRTNQERTERHESLYPGTPLPPRGTGLGISQEFDAPVLTIWGALLAGLGLGVGFAVVNKVIKS